MMTLLAAAAAGWLGWRQASPAAAAAVLVAALALGALARAGVVASRDQLGLASDWGAWLAAAILINGAAVAAGWAAGRWLGRHKKPD